MKTLARNAFQISQDYYPETYVRRICCPIRFIDFTRMGQLAIVNAPSTFTMIWSVIRRWISQETASKVDILGHDYQKVLLDLIDEENLPTSLGGKCTCEEAGGCHLSGAGPWQEGRVGWGPHAIGKASAGPA